MTKKSYALSVSAQMPDQSVSSAPLSRLYLDFNSFFAAAEQHFNPDLRGKAIGVVPLDVPNTGCIAISREAKALGVSGSASVREVRKSAPDMILVVARPDAYVRLHHRILRTIESCLPIAKVRSIDEVVCHLLPADTADHLMLARKIKSELATAFSSGLTCSIGIAQTELLAKIAAEMKKPDGLIVLESDKVLGKIAHLPLEDIPGISEGIGARLRRAGIHDVTALWNMGPKHMRALWGSIEGERFWNALHGLHYERPETQKRMFGHSRMLPLDWRTLDKMHECSRQLLFGAARRLRRSTYRATKLTLSVRGGGYRSDQGSKSDTDRWKAEIKYLAARDDQALLRELGRLFDRYGKEVRFTPRSVSVMLHGLVDADERQGDLLGLAGMSDTKRVRGDDRERRERLSAALDQLRQKHGAAAVSLGPQVDMPGGYLGAKIAFGRIPDMADFSETASADHETHFCTV